MCAESGSDGFIRAEAGACASDCLQASPRSGACFWVPSIGACSPESSASL